MEIEQITKRLEWLDDERRRDKSVIATLENRIVQLEDNLTSSKKEYAKLESSLNQFNLIFGKLDQVEGMIAQLKVEIGKLGEVTSQNIKKSEQDQDKKRISAIDGVSKTIQEMQKSVLLIKDLVKGQKVLETDYENLKSQINKLDDKLISNQTSIDEVQRVHKLFDETRKADNKRITDLQGEVSAYRKRNDELRSKIDLALENLRNMEARIVEITSSESARRKGQVAFFEKQNQLQVERDKTLNEWSNKLEQVVKTNTAFDLQLKNLEETLRNVRKSKEQLDDATQKIDRRINEITEMHRLNEDHFKQEWNAFKADDVKRWANYNLIMDEQQKDNQRQSSKLEKRIIQLEDNGQELSDQMVSVHGETEKRLQNLLSLAQDWLSAYERILGKNSDLD